MDHPGSFICHTAIHNFGVPIHKAIQIIASCRVPDVKHLTSGGQALEIASKHQLATQAAHLLVRKMDIYSKLVGQQAVKFTMNLTCSSFSSCLFIVEKTKI